MFLSNFMKLKLMFSKHAQQQMVSVPNSSGSTFSLKIICNVIVIFLCYFKSSTHRFVTLADLKRQLSEKLICHTCISLKALCFQVSKVL